MVELERERAGARGRRADLDNEVADFGLRYLGAHHVPAVPAFARVEAENLTAASRQQRVDLCGRFGRTDDLDEMDRLEQHRLALRQAFGDANASRGPKRYIGRVDRVVRAVDQRHMKVDHGKAQRPVLQAVDYAFPDRGDVVAPNDAAADLIFKRESRASRHRSDVEHDIAVLAVPT